MAYWKLQVNFVACFRFETANKLEPIYFPIAIPFLKVIFHLLNIIRKISVLKINKMFGKNSDFSSFVLPWLCVFEVGEGGVPCLQPYCWICWRISSDLTPGQGWSHSHHCWEEIGPTDQICIVKMKRLDLQIRFVLLNWRDWTYRSDLYC